MIILNNKQRVQQLSQFLQIEYNNNLVCWYYMFLFIPGTIVSLIAQYLPFFFHRLANRILLSIIIITIYSFCFGLFLSSIFLLMLNN